MDNDGAGRQSRLEVRSPRQQTQQTQERQAAPSRPDHPGHARHTADPRRGSARPEHEHAHAGGGREADERVPSGTLLTGPELLVLQLLAGGYPRAQIAALAWMPVAAVEQVEHSACVALGVAMTQEAVERARHRGLIV